MLTAVAGLVLVVGGCGGRPEPLDRADGGGGQADALRYDGGRHDISLGLIKEAEDVLSNPGGWMPAGPQK